MKKLKIGLVPRLIIAIVLGIILGLYAPLGILRIFKTFSTFFSSFLSFFIPFMIIGFVIAGIAKLTHGAGKLLLFTVVISYISTILAGTFSYTVGSIFYPNIVKHIDINEINVATRSLSPYFTIPLKPAFDVTTAIVFAFMMGILISYFRVRNKLETTFNLFNEFEQVVTKVLSAFIIPLLPLYILGIFIDLTYSGSVFVVLKVFLTIYLFIFAMHYIYIFVMFLIAGGLTKKSPFFFIKNQIPAYFTAIGTQSSAATIPVNRKSGLNNGTSEEVVDFVIPLCATIHLAGSMITLTSCILGVLLLNGLPHSFAIMFPFLAMLGIALVAAPGAPGGAVISALPFLYLIGISPESSMATLLIALYLTQDSFGTAINVSGDNAIAVYVDAFYKKYIKKN